MKVVGSKRIMEDDGMMGLKCMNEDGGIDVYE
jgi:hypothetical protein